MHNTTSKNDPIAESSAKPQESEESAFRHVEELQRELFDLDYKLEILLSAVQALHADSQSNSILDAVARLAREITRADAAVVSIVSDDRKTYRYAAADGIGVCDLMGESIPIGTGFCGWVWEKKPAGWGGSVHDVPSENELAWPEKNQAVILAPLMSGSQLLGGIACVRGNGDESFSRRDLRLLMLFAGHAAAAMRRAWSAKEVAAALEVANGLREGLEKTHEELERAYSDLETIALYDRLTKLPNRSLLQDRTRLALAKAKAESESVALLVLDLDRFKEINDTLGALAGDRLIREMGQRLERCCPPGSTVARIGGDVFGIMLAPADAISATAVAKNLLEAVEEPVADRSGDFSLSASIGIAVFPEHEVSGEGLQKCAESAMQEAKKNKQNVAIFHPIHRESKTLLSKGELRAGIDRGQFQLYFQPKISLKTGTLVSVEALSRWNHPQKGLLNPCDFIPALEDLGMMPLFNQWVLEDAIRQLGVWNQRGLTFQVAANISIHSLINPIAFDDLKKAIQTCETPERLTLEITENLFLSDYGMLKEKLEFLRNFGVIFSIDDFGTGHSSLSRLKQLPVTELKIDRSFVGELARSADDEVIVRSTIDLGHNLGLCVVAEGVEDAGALKKLVALGCDIAQGFYFGKPMTANDLEARFARGEWGGETKGSQKNQE